MSGSRMRVWVMLGAAGLCLVVFFATMAWVFDGTAVTAAAAEFDRSISHAFLDIREPALTGRVLEISALGSAPGLTILGIIACSVIIRARDWVGLSQFAATVLGASVLSRLLQHIWNRPRPDTQLSYVIVTPGSFPSAHLFGAAACYFTFAFFYARYAQLQGKSLATEIAVHAGAAVIVLLIATSRVYLGAHHTTDVIAGTAGGWAFALLVAALFSLRYGDQPPARRAAR